LPFALILDFLEGYFVFFYLPLLLPLVLTLVLVVLALVLLVEVINKLEGLDSGAVVEIIQRFIPQAAELTTVFLMSCYSDSCLNILLS
jgi:uncharacterized BrkB/YihY/UPF0761 family membrane protein